MITDVERHSFDLATAVTTVGKDTFVASPSRDYWAFVGPFGGATAATLLRALLSHADASGEPIALTVNYAAPLEAGQFQIKTKRVRSNRSTQHWNFEVTQGSDSEPRTTASAILAERRATWSHHSAAPPRLRPQHELAAYRPGKTVSWVDRYRFYFDSGAPERSAEPFATPRSAQSVLWLSDEPPRTVDFLSLTAMADTFFGRIFQVRGTIVPFGTVALTTYFQTNSQELEKLKLQSVIGRADARRFHSSYCDQTGELWSPDGCLLATTHQIAFYKA